ncbi:AmmeMemoRadiSam system protein B [bacterium]|nr:AmmeMemoRadiSam system protein B [bacterium]
MIRKPAVAGYFYERYKDRLIEEIESCFKGKLGPGKLPEVGSGEGRILALVSPHAGFIYSGQAAAHAYYALAMDGMPERIVIIGPNHRALGEEVALYPKGEWQTPLGNVKIDEELAKEILAQSDVIRSDPAAHLLEHSIEVQLPFLQYIFGNKFTFVPIIVYNQTLPVAIHIGQTLAKVLAGQRAIVIASTDLTHYEPKAMANQKDGMIIDCIKNMDETRLFLTIGKYRISMCGPAGVAAAIVFAREFGGREGILYQYYTSGDITGDMMEVVGYCSMGIVK